MGLRLKQPWIIKSIELENTGEYEGLLHIHLDYKKGSKFIYEDKEYTVYDHQERTWRHLIFFEHNCYYIHEFQG